MNATRNDRSHAAITRLIPFAFALMLVFTSLATTGCDTLDSNEPIEAERVLMLEPVESIASQDDGAEKRYIPEDDLGDSSIGDSYDNPVKDYSKPGDESQVIGPLADESCVPDKKGGHFVCLP